MVPGGRHNRLGDVTDKSECRGHCGHPASGSRDGGGGSSGSGSCSSGRDGGGVGGIGNQWWGWSCGWNHGWVRDRVRSGGDGGNCKETCADDASTCNSG